MKKTYENPTAELLAFRYRDQVVAASGVDAANNEEVVTLSKEEQLRNLLADGVSWDDLPEFLKILFG